MDDKKKKENEKETKGTSVEPTQEITDFDEIKKADDAAGADKKSQKETADSKDGEKEKKTADSKDGKKEKESVASKDGEKAKSDENKETGEKKEKETPAPKDGEKTASDEKSETDEKKETTEKNAVTPKDGEKAKSDKKSETDEKKEKESVTSKDGEKAKSDEKPETEEKEANASKEGDKAKSEEKPQTDKKGEKEVTTPKDEEKVTSDEDKEKDDRYYNPKDSRKGKKIAGIILLTVVVLLAIVYAGGYIYFSGHFYPDVAINGVTASNMSKEQTKQKLDDFYTDYTLTMDTIDGKQLSVNGKDISMQITLHDEMNDCIRQQQPYLWFVNMFGHHDYTVGADAVWDEKALDTEYDSMKILDKKLMVAPKDAYVGVEDGKFKIVKEVLGSTIDTAAFKKAVENSLSTVQSVLNLKEAGCYKLPTVYEADEELQAEYEAKNAYGKNVIKLKLDDLTLEPGMELYNAVLEKKGENYQISKNLVKKYVESLAKEYDTMETERTFTTSFSSKKVKVFGSAFGYKMNQQETTDALYKALNAGKSATVEAVFESKGYTLQGENDIGKTYVEVNLSEQRVIAYKNGKKIAEGDCVSGKEATGDGTCIGLYAIQDKKSPTVLRGEKVQVTKYVTKKKKGKKVKVKQTSSEYEYESPVTFWLQFNGGIGLHDAAGWRSQYGGSIYYYSGSHGCVNLPYDLAETIYNNFEIGDPVVVYFWDNENRK